MKKLICMLGAAILFQMAAAQTESKKEELVHSGKEVYLNENGRSFQVNTKIVTVKPKDGATRLFNKYHVIRTNLLGFCDVEVPETEDVERFVQFLRDSKEYESVDFNVFGEYAYVPNDTYIGPQWHLQTINAYNAWNITTGSPNVKVAVIDSGVDTGNSDIGYGNDNYKNIDESVGFNETPSNYHGTFVAGILGAKTNNSYGIAGVSGGNNQSGVTMIPYCVGHSSPDASLVDDAILDAVSEGAKVIQLSLSLGTNTAVSSAIEYAYDNNVTIVCAAGNDDSSSISYPACHDKVIAVGATDSSNIRADFSNYGTGLDLVAPGENIYSTMLNNTFGVNSGTSFAAPQVSGVATLMLSVNPSLSPSDIRQILIGTCQKLTNTYTFNSNGWNNEVGYGLINAYAAVCAAKASITGSTVLCNSNVYSISNLPTGATVSWSLVGGNTSSVSLQSDSPSANQCTLTLTNASGFNTVTLQADVIMNGVTMKSLQKVISKPLPFFGTYEETSILYNGSFTPSIPLTAIPSSREMDVYVGGLVKVKSDYFSGKSISISGPYTNYYRSGSLVRFTLSSWSGAPVVITVQAEGCDDEVRLKFFPAVMLDDYSLNISPDGNSTYALSLIRKTEDGVLPETSSAADDCAAPRLFSKPWTLEVTNALTGRKAFSKEVAEPSFLLHTDGWEAGVYVVRALVGDASLAGKITVK